MAGRILAQVLIMGGQVFGRAAMQAYQKALQSNSPFSVFTFALQTLQFTRFDFLDAKTGGVTAAVSRGMNVAEARLVLNVEENATKEQIIEVIAHPVPGAFFT